MKLLSPAKDQEEPYLIGHISLQLLERTVWPDGTTAYVPIKNPVLLKRIVVLDYEEVLK